MGNKRSLAGIAFSLLFFAFLPSFLSATDYKLEEWQTHTSLKNSRSASVDSKGRIWAATTGGLFIVDPGNGSINTYRNIDALISLNLNVVKCNPQEQKAFIGTTDGILEIVTEDMEWTHITDIQMSDYENKSINDILFLGNKAYVAGGFGITVFDINENIFIETCSRLGEFSSNTVVSRIIFHNDTIWAATDKGIGYVDINALFSDPSSWSNITIEDGLPDESIKDITFMNDTLYVLSDHALAKHKDGSFENIIETENYKLINLNKYKDDLLFSAAGYLQSTDMDFLNPQYPSAINRFAVAEINGKEMLVLSFEKDGIGIIETGELEVYSPNSPVSNQFTDIKVDQKDKLWVTTGTSESGDGFMSYKNGEWHNYTAGSLDGIESNYYWKVQVLDDNRKVFSGYGPGYITLDDNSQEFEILNFDESNTPLVGFVPGFVIVGEVRQDYNGTTWIANMGESTGGPVLVAIDKDGEWHSFPNCISPSDRYYINLEIDFSGTKWMSSYYSVGIYYFNDNGTLDDKSDDICGKITASNSSLPDNIVNAIAIDANDMIWAGTTEGLSVILNPYAVLSGSDVVVRNVNIIGNQEVNDILVDALDNKWIATGDGVWLLNPDATEVLAHFTTSNSDLISDKIIALGTNPKNGKMYFGSEKGMSEAVGLSIQPLQEFDIICYPQPFYPGTDEYLSIEGLAANSDIRIMTVNGELVKNLTTQSRKTLWDGTDSSGQYVGSGVYIIVGSSTDEDKSGVAKIAVIKK